jgi:hypothetical protein
VSAGAIVFAVRIYVKEMDEFFSWMDHEGFAYVVLRNADELVQRYPEPGSKNDVDLLVADAAIEAIGRKYGRVSRRAGVKCDVYSLQAGHGADFLGHAYFPAPLAGSLVAHRVRSERRFYIPAAQDSFDSLLFHIAYHKAETSGFKDDQPVSDGATKYHPVLHRLMKALGIKVPLTLRGFHEYLASRGYAPTFDRLAAYVQNDFAHHRKGRFFARLFTHQPGEMNLFVIRAAAVQRRAHISLIHWLRRHYRILFLKRIDFYARAILSRRMRGNKWRRGGKPWIALVVFDRKPVATSTEDRKVHPLVFNKTQFVKREMRDWFVANHPVRDSANPIHSTDNEAEAIGHFPLFFTAAEQECIFKRLAAARRRLAEFPETPSARWIELNDENP